ncbi:carbohydrate-binding family V/XII [Paraburkholderia sp. A1RI-2L]|uniref:carbohydrate-binding family V/XII n=1 Tax=Paraburkholderia sp. A1RI-2L TaxID=3028367 RepID=UPI003B796844
MLSITALMWNAPAARAADAPATQAQSADQRGWPRMLENGTERVEMFQPQIEQWTGNRIAGRAAIAVGASNGTPTYGIAHFSAQADIDKAAGLVQLTQIHIASVEVPTDTSLAGRVKGALVAHIPSSGMTVSLDQLQTSYAASQGLDRSMRIAVKNDVPQIVFKDTPTVLVLVDGAPAWRPIAGTGFSRAINSRALLMRDANGAVYVHAAGYWYTAQGLSGPWRQVAGPQQALLAAAQTSEKHTAADAMLPSDGKPVVPAPALMLATQPTELVVTQGAAQMSPVAGTNLLTITNTDHAVFVYPSTNTYYLLISGRWFRAASTSGPWRWVPGSDLPPDFAKISTHDPKANVLVSVPNTPEAKEAEIAATIPQTATVSRSQARLTVNYDGAPRFQPVSGTSLNYAVNTATPVIEVDASNFYAVSNGVWFVSGSALGPWTVATSVPGVIYTIPVSSPIHYVTYVQIYSYTPDTVVVGYTPGYMGVVISPDGTVVYGTGYVYPAYVGDVYYGYPATYGYGAGFALGAAEGFAFGFAAGAIWGCSSPYWGPYWGGYWGGGGWGSVNINQTNFYGRWGQGTVTHASGWNGWTGTQWRGAAGAGYNPVTGAHYRGAAGGAFNPYSGNYAAGHQGAYSNPVTGRQAAGRGGVVGNQYNGNYAGGREVGGYNPNTGRSGAAEFGVAGNTQTGQHEAGSRGYVTNHNNGNSVAWNNGDVYAGHDGNVYRHTADNGWQQHTSNGWQSAQPGGDLGNDLNRQQGARSLGEQRFGGGFGSRGGWSGGGMGGRFGGGFHGGFRR